MVNVHDWIVHYPHCCLDDECIDESNLGRRRSQFVLLSSDTSLKLVHTESIFACCALPRFYLPVLHFDLQLGHRHARPGTRVEQFLTERVELVRRRSRLVDLRHDHPNSLGQPQSGPGATAKVGS